MDFFPGRHRHAHTETATHTDVDLVGIAYTGQPLYNVLVIGHCLDLP